MEEIKEFVMGKENWVCGRELMACPAYLSSEIKPHIIGKECWIPFINPLLFWILGKTFAQRIIGHFFNVTHIFDSASTLCTSAMTHLTAQMCLETRSSPLTLINSILTLLHSGSSIKKKKREPHYQWNIILLPLEKTSHSALCLSAMAPPQVAVEENHRVTDGACKGSSWRK